MSGPVMIPILAIITGLLLGGLIVALTTEEVYTTFAQSPVQAILTGLNAAWKSYVALFTGAIGDPARMIAAIQAGEGEEIRRAFNPFFESLVQSTPYIFAGLAVALGFRAGLFNIGAEGQLFVGAMTGVWVGFAIKGLPPVIHIPLALLAGAAGGALWGFIPGFLKARTGGHEVINTIMMNYIAFRLSEFMLRGPLKRPESANPVSPLIEESAKLPRLFEDPIRFHIGFFIALGFAWLVWWFLFRTRWGFDLRTVGANPNAARYAGMNITLVTIVAMSLSGGLAGLAGINEVLGVNHNLALAFSSGYGFDAIALALLGKSHPAGVVLGALLFGFLRNGAVQMQLTAGIPIDIIQVMQAMILAFAAAPAIIRTIYRLRPPKEAEEGLLVRGWGG
ncbi:MAG: ABC transporter permease [Chloroflexi bacterium]|nr:MAG: ABC transporter permease [Chloroflexota bacterium]MBL1194684.1 ABC transporter permease [Chloroflexota bacterium]NOH11975.1 ABC transporter permease [Chloroflexota bacterium]